MEETDLEQAILGVVETSKRVKWAQPWSRGKGGLPGEKALRQLS